MLSKNDLITFFLLYSFLCALCALCGFLLKGLRRRRGDIKSVGIGIIFFLTQRSAKVSAEGRGVLFFMYLVIRSWISNYWGFIFVGFVSYALQTHIVEYYLEL